MKPPRERFLESKFAKAHADLAISEGFLSALEYAMLQFVQDQPITGDPTKQWDCHSQLIGARKFMETLKTLADPVVAPKNPAQESLNYNLKK